MTSLPFPGLRILDAPRSPSWPISDLKLGDRFVGSLVPGGFEAYLRIFNPFYDPNSPDGAVRWRNVASVAGSELGAETSYTDLLGSSQLAEHRYVDPLRGSLSEDDTRTLVSVLGLYTADPDDCYFAVWEGHGWFRAAAEDLGGPPRVAGRHLAYLLFAGPLAAATSVRSPTDFQSPTLWWPADRAWCVATDPDLYSTYIGGSESLVQGLEAETSLETVRVQLANASCRGPYPPLG
jgi:hypothetical protein